MNTRTLQPSEYEIQREVEALRDIRRRSTTPGALTIDPDLPNQSPPSSPTTTGYWSGASGTPSSFTSVDSTSSVGSHIDNSSSDLDSGTGRSDQTDGSTNPNNPADDPFHLFWVPASLHPEIAPAEFRAFLKEHARAPAPGDGTAVLERSNSTSSLSAASGLGRKKSMLSRQYRPSDNDGVEHETVVPLRRNRSSLYTNRGPQLTISDLQKLEELAEEASESDDPSRLRNVLRRSLSLNVSPTAIGQMEDMPEIGDEADAPIIVPPPGQILRRAARTKIRKPGLPGDGGGHRFGPVRRGATAKSITPPTEPRTSSDISSSDHGDSIESSQRRRTFSDEGPNQRDSFSEEASSIFDAYARDDDDDEDDPHAPVVVTSPPSPVMVELPESPPQPEIQPALLEALGPVLHHPQPQHLLTPQSSTEIQEPSRTPSPSNSEASPTPPPLDVQPTTASPPAFLSTAPSPPAHHQRKDKDKKGLFGKWGGDKGGKKNGKSESRERVSAEKEKEKEKESGFFGSLFGGSKKKQDSDYPPPIGSPGGPSGRETAAALLGASKSSKSYVPPTSPGLAPGPNSYARYPIHVERAIYRLSHIKLANPRRPLYEQVLISNLMFWYLGVINKAQSAGPTPNGQPVTGVAVGAGPGEQNDAESEQREKEQREKEQREKVEKERLDKERAEKEQREREMESKKRESGRRGSLTKTPAGGPPGGRRAEMPIKGPQYEMQHRVMEKEYSGYNGQPQPAPMNRAASAPAGNAGQQYPRNQQPQQFPNTPPKLVQPQPQSQAQDQFYYLTDKQNQQQQSRLPPGAMAPVPVSAPTPRKPSTSSPSPSSVPHRQSRSPPPQHHGQQPLTQNRYNSNVAQEVTGGIGRGPSRSLSATAVPSPQPPVNGKVRKGTSAHAVPAYGRRPRTSEGNVEQNGTGEEEDVPLAVWQQQRRR